MHPFVIKLLEETTLINECLICNLTPSQVYANIKGHGKAHRYIWEKIFGEIPTGMFVCHDCDNPRCINPQHLFLGTPQDNMTDKVLKGRQTFGGPGRLLSLEHFPRIVSMRYNNKTFKEIGNSLLVSRRTVKRLLEDCPHD